MVLRDDRRPGVRRPVSNRVLIAATDTSTITGTTVITKFQFDNSTVAPASANSFADYPTLGIDAQAMYIGVNVFSTATSSFVRTDGYVVRKSSCCRAGRWWSPRSGGSRPEWARARSRLRVSTTTTPRRTRATSLAWTTPCSACSNSDGSRTPGGTPSISSNIPITVPTTTFPARVPHLGNTGGLNGGPRLPRRPAVRRPHQEREAVDGPQLPGEHVGRRVHRRREPCRRPVVRAHRYQDRRRVAVDRAVGHDLRPRGHQSEALLHSLGHGFRPGTRRVRLQRRPDWPIGRTRRPSGGWPVTRWERRRRSSPTRPRRSTTTRRPTRAGPRAGDGATTRTRASTRSTT